MTPGNLVTVFRGATAYFASTFYDKNGAVTQPSGASVHLDFQQGGAEQTVSIEMTAPVSPAVAWTAEWDTRGIDPGQVDWSIHSEGTGIPYAVQDGAFVLAANNANLETF